MIYVHIGLHKTASTSLQASVFPNIDDLVFLGRVNLPFKLQEPLYRQMIKYCCDINGNVDALVIRDDLKQYGVLGAEKDLLVSDEWFTAAYSYPYGFGCSWTEKVRRLSELLVGFDYKIMMVVRKPSDGLFSQYQEFMNVGIDEFYSTVSEYVLQSDDALAWDVRHCTDYLSQYLGNVSVFDFQDIVNDVSRSRLLSIFFDRDVNVALVHYNSKAYDKNSVIRRRPSLIGFLVDKAPERLHGALRRFLNVKILSRLWQVMSQREFKVRESVFGLSHEAELELGRLDRSFNEFFDGLR